MHNPTRGLPFISLAAFASLAPAAPPLPSVESALTLQSEPAKLALAPTKSGSAEQVFGQRDTMWIGVGTGWSHNFNKDDGFELYGSFRYFLAENVEVIGQVGLWYYSQNGDDAFGVNPVAIFRWHFLRRERWTLFTDVGIGAVFTDDNVPDRGTSLNFTPRAGAGFTYQLDPDYGARLEGGFTWAHVSNARIHDDDNNPGRDSAMVYLGVVFPF